jgi:hypothetical protein
VIFEDKRLYLFVHVAKTGGTTVREFFAQNLERQNTFIHLGNPTYAQEKESGLLPFAERPVEQRAKALVICGHDVNCRTHLLVPGKIPYYITFLREPAEKLVSYYNFDMNKRAKKQEPLIAFEEWYQTGRSNNITLGWLYRNVFCEEKPRHVNSSVYKRVLRRLHDFWFVGCSEHLDRDFPLLLRFVGLSGTAERANVSGVNFPKRVELTRELRTYLNNDNALDFELYSYWKERLDKRVRELHSLLAETEANPNVVADTGTLRNWWRGLFGVASLPWQVLADL